MVVGIDFSSAHGSSKQESGLYFQGGPPTIFINGVITPTNGLING